jgi:hypothetical protein
VNFCIWQRPLTDADMARRHAEVFLEVLRGEAFAKPNPSPMFPNPHGLLASSLTPAEAAGERVYQDLESRRCGWHEATVRHDDKLTAAPPTKCHENVHSEGVFDCVGWLDSTAGGKAETPLCCQGVETNLWTSRAKDALV